jgi:hypothetical protein
MREDGCVMPGRPAHDAEASSSRAALPASGGPATRLEQERERVDAPPAHFASAQAEQALWQEFRDHGASLNRALNETLRIHGGPAWRIFQVSDFPPGFVVVPFISSAWVLSLAPVFSRLARQRQDLERGPGRGTTLSTAWTPSSTGTGGNTTPSTPSSRP